jgi:hypothetical protein
MKAIDVACPACGVAPQQECTGTPRTKFHTSRVARARYDTNAERVIKNRRNKALDEARRKVRP